MRSANHALTPSCNKGHTIPLLAVPSILNLYSVTESNQPRIALLTDDLSFPPLHESWEGLLAVGGDLSEARLIAAYEAGVFPWYGEEDPILWWAPEKRSILHLDELKLFQKACETSSIADFLKSAWIRVSNRSCARVEISDREGEGTWISEEITEAYVALHRLGLAHSVENMAQRRACWWALWHFDRAHVFRRKYVFSYEQRLEGRIHSFGKVGKKNAVLAP